MTPAIVRKVENRAIHSISEHTANAARCTLSELQQFAGGVHDAINDAQERLLAVHFGLDGNDNFNRNRSANK